MKKQFYLTGIIAVLTVIFLIAGCGKNAKNPVSISDIEQQIKALGMESGAIECEPTGVCASAVDEFSQGTLLNGNPVSAGRTDPDNALGAVDDLFFSLGFNKNPDGTFQEEGGYIVVMFDDKYTGTALTVWEETHGTYPLEQAKVYISKNGTDWEYVGIATNTNGSAYQRPTEFDIEGKCFQYVKIVDITNPEDFVNKPDADAFDVNAVCIEDAEKCQVCEPFITDLWAGAAQNDLTKGTLVGQVTVWNSPDGSVLYVKYDITEEEWYLSEAHVYAETVMPTTGAPGQLGHTMEFEGTDTKTYTFEISKEEGWDCGTGLYVAAHAKVCKPGEGEPYTQYVQGIISEQTLWAGQNIDAGTVTAAVEGENLVVTYTTVDGWELTETHLAIAKTLEEIPQTKKGNPIPGQFPYKHEDLGGVTTDSYTIPLSDLTVECGDMLYIAAHAAMQKLLGYDEYENPIYQTETGWGGEGDFPGKNWANYFTITIECETVYPEPDCETAWAFGNYELDDYITAAKWGWFFDYIICCE